MGMKGEVAPAVLSLQPILNKYVLVFSDQMIHLLLCLNRVNSTHFEALGLLLRFNFPIQVQNQEAVLVSQCYLNLSLEWQLFPQILPSWVL
jgi:hypothetical protein